MKIFLITVKLILTGLAAFLLIWLFFKNLVLSGRFEVSYHFEPSPFISALRPSERLIEVEINDKGEKFRKIIGDPTYFDLHLPSSFEQVDLEIIYDNPKDKKIILGGFTNRKDWKFKTPEIVFHKLEDGKQAARANFKLEELELLTRTATFVIGVPEASQEEAVIIYKIRTFATKDPIAIKDVPAKILGYLKNKFQ